jgi:hypothetical protein
MVFVGIVLCMKYFFTETAIEGRVRSGEYPFAIGVLEGRSSVPRGIAFEVGQTADGLATWKLKVRGADVPGRFVIDNGRFAPVEPDRTDPSPGSARRIERDPQPSQFPRLPGPKASGSNSDSFFLRTSRPSQTLSTRASGPNSLSTWRHAPQGADGLIVGV